ncbi:polysaccharide deacetylase family protein [Haliea sp.]|uniref:polysaccharide deacetylase family protein n=1 Tax=Haliea sp. TaxID=1932666 RepID=UPI003527A6ED
MKLKHLLLLLAKWTGLFALSRRATSNRLRILAYHGINTTNPQFGNFLFMSADKFADRMALLSKWGYPVIALDNAWPPKAEKPWPPGATVITIDDGWQSSCQYMIPILQDHGYAATIYLTTYYCIHQFPVADVALSYCVRTTKLGSQLHIAKYDFGPYTIDSEKQREKLVDLARRKLLSLRDEEQRQSFVRLAYESCDMDYTEVERNRAFHLMSADEVATTASAKIRFELHTHRHRISTSNSFTLEEELVQNAAIIEGLTKLLPKHFCYPNGLADKRAKAVLSDLAVQSATTMRMGLARRETCGYAIPRITDGQHVSTLEFEAEMCGFMDSLRALHHSIGGGARQERLPKMPKKY